MYTYVKVKRKDLNLNYGWLLKITNFKELMDYQKNIDIPRNANALTQILEKETFNKMNKFYGHFTNKLAGISDEISKIKGIDSLAELTNLSSKSLIGKIKWLNQNKILLINHNGGYFYLTDDYEILDTIKKDTVGSPNFSVKDINVFQWKNGTHWYAKISHIDVVDDNNNAKWDSYREARIAALKYLEEL